MNSLEKIDALGRSRPSERELPNASSSRANQGTNVSSFDFAEIRGPKGYHPLETSMNPSVPKMHIASRGTRTSRVIYPSNWIDHREYDSSLLSFYSNDMRDELATTELLSDNERGEFIRFYDALYLWDKFVPKIERQFEPEFYWTNSITRGAEFAEWLKDYSGYSYRVGWGIDYSPPVSGVKPLKGYNDLFPYQGLLKFREEVSDYEYSLVEVGKFLDDDVDDLKRIMRNMIKRIHKLELVSEYEILSEPSTSSSYLEEKDKTIPNCLVEDNSFAEEMVGRRCVVPVYPGGTRDTVILTKSSSNTVKLLERQMRHILEHIRESAVTSKGSTYRSRLDAIQRSDEYSVHFLRDIKKCGHTFPIQHLIEPFIEVMNERFPSEFWYKYRIFKDRRVKGYSKTTDWTYPNRGYFLGMANHLCTFLLIAVYRLSIKRFYEVYPKAPVRFAGIIGNDDSDIWITPKRGARYNEALVVKYAKLYVDYHAMTMSAFGIWYNSKKSFLSHRSLFYEEYDIDEFRLKQSRYAMIMANCISLPSIRMAKHMLKSFLSSVDKLDLVTLSPMIDYALSIIGIEFDADEGKRDYYLGGWIPKRTNYLSDVLFELKDPEKDPRYLARIFDYVRGVEALGRPHPSSVEEISENTSPLVTAMGITGKPSQFLSGIVMSKKERRKFYTKLIDFERKPNGYVSLTKNLWSKIKTKDYSNSLEDLQKDILLKIDCNLPVYLVKTFDENPMLVNSTWIGLSDLEVPNRTIKALCYEVAKGDLKSDLDIPYQEGWEYLSLSSNFYMPQYVADYPFVPVTRDGNARHSCSDSFASLGNFAVKHGRFPKDLVFNIPERKIPPWRFIEHFTQGIILTCDEIEESLGSAVTPQDLNFIGIQVITATKRVEVKEPEEQIEEEEILEEEEDPIPKIDFRSSDWMLLFENPALKDQYRNEPCEYHIEGSGVRPMIYALHCLACQIWVWDPHDDQDDPETRERNATIPRADALLRRIGLDPDENEFFGESGSEGGLGFGFD